MATAADRRHADLKQMLEQRRHAVLNGGLQGVRAASGDTGLARAGEVRDTGDEGEAMLQDALRYALISMNTEMVIRIDRAIERLVEGTYGICDECGEDINRSRLQALPFAERCLRCEESREDVERQRLWRSRIRNWRVSDTPSSEC